MRSPRLFLPLLLALALLSAQQEGVEHALIHGFEQQSQKDKQAPHSNTCDKCNTYAQLGSALNPGNFNFVAAQASAESIRPFSPFFRTIHSLTAVARGPPAIL